MRAVKSPGAFENVTQLRQAWQALSASLALPETEDTWERLEKSLKLLAIQLRAVAEGSKRDTFENDVASYLKETDFCRDLSSALLTERTRLSGSALDFLGAASCVASSAFGICIGLYLPVLIKLLARPNKIYVTRTCNCLAEIIHSCRHPHILTFLANGLDDKSSAVRRSCVEMVLESLTGGSNRSLLMDKHALEKRLGCIEETIRKGATDKEVKIRELSRSVWDVYKREWPDRVADFSQPLTPIIRRYLNLPANAVRPPSPPKFIRPRAASPTRSHGSGAELKRSAKQQPNLKTSKSTSHLAASTGSSRRERDQIEAQTGSTGPPQSHPERQPSIIDQLYHSLAPESSKPNPFHQQQPRRPTAATSASSAGVSSKAQTAQRSVSAKPDFQISASISASDKYGTLGIASSARAPPLNSTNRPMASRKPGRAVTAAPLLSAVPPQSTSPEAQPPSTLQSRSRVLSASTKPAEPMSGTSSPKSTDDKAELEFPLLTSRPQTIEPSTDRGQAKEKKATIAVDKEDVAQPAAVSKPLASRPALANATNRPQATASRALKKAPAPSAGRAAFKPKRPVNPTASLLGTSKGPSARPPPTTSTNSKPSLTSEKVQQTEPKEDRQPPPLTQPTGGIRGSPIKPKPRAVAALPPKAAIAKKGLVVASKERKVQSSTTRRMNHASGGLERSTATSDAKAKEARERRRKREELSGKSKIAPKVQAHEAVASPSVPAASQKEAPQRLEEPPKAKVQSNPFLGVFSSAQKPEVVALVGSSSPTKQPPPQPQQTTVALPFTLDLYPESLPSPCIKPYLIPLPDTSDSSLYSISASRLPASLVLDNQTVAKAEFSFPTSAAQFALSTKKDVPENKYMKQNLPSPNSSLARQFDKLQAMTPDSVPEASEQEETVAAELERSYTTPSSKRPTKSSRPSTFQWEEHSLSAFDLPGLANDAEAAETTMITSQGYPGLESPGLEAVRNIDDLSMFAATPIVRRVATASSH